MQRRTFIKDSTLTAVALTAFGSIRFNGKNYEGDCETTTDILGPFYRPDAPVRNNMRIKNATGQLVVLSGQVRHKDCTTPLKNACVELWHCDGNGVYDNESADFKYRAKTFCDEKGNYHFNTIIPVPYKVGGNITRPAHYHMMISAPGYQNLITQLYFTGDKHIAADGSASLPAAKKRILDIKNGAAGEKAVTFNVTMQEKLPADAAVIDRLSGTYKKTDNSIVAFYKKDKMLWIKDPESINGGYPLAYAGNNTFEDYGMESSYQFLLEKDGVIKLSYKAKTWSKQQVSWDAVKSNP